MKEKNMNIYRSKTFYLSSITRLIRKTVTFFLFLYSLTVVRILITSLLLLSLIHLPALAAAPADGTYIFSSLGPASGGFKPDGNGFLLMSEAFDIYGAGELFIPGQTQNCSNMIIKADNEDVASFTLNNMAFWHWMGDECWYTSFRITGVKTDNSTVSTTLTGNIPGPNVAAAAQATVLGANFSSFTNIKELRFDITGYAGLIENLTFYTITISDAVAPATVPTATTNAATSVTSTGATLNGTVNANGTSTTVTFEYGLNTSYGTTVTATQSPVTGNSNTSVSKAITGLSKGTTYHYRVKGVNSEGATNGSDMTFTTLAEAPTATTNAATSVTSTGATLNGTINANGASTTVTFEYGLTTSYGTSVTATQSPVTGDSNTSVSKAITGLSKGTTYHYRVKGVNSKGTTYGSDQTFTTLAEAPSATTNAASSVTSTGATLNGTVNANGASTTVTFEYGLTTSYGTTVTATQSPVTGDSNTSVSKAITGLSKGTTYHYRVKGVNSKGTTYGSDQTFTTLAEAPSATTNAASSVTSTGATLNGTVNANGASTTVTFEYGLTTGYGTTVTAVQSPVTGDSNTSVSKAITGLSKGTTYHYRVKGVNSEGTTYGADQTFTTTAPEMDVSGLGNSIADGDANPATSDDTDFGSVAVVGGTNANTFTITNSGTDTLNLTDTPRVAIGGTHASDFTLTTDAATTVASGGGTTTFVVTFDPSALGLRTATVSIATDDSDENPYNFSIQGTGTNTAPVFTAAGPFSVDETATNATSVGDVDANDADGGGTDSVTYSIEGGTGQSLFDINSSNGQITVNATGASTLDYESVTSYTLTVRADDGEASNNTTDQSVTININDIEPAIANQTVGSVAENAANSTSVGTVAVTNDTNSVAFSITAGNTGGAFAINSSTGEITVNDTSAIDYESSTSFSLTVQVTDDGETTTDDATVTVNVTDVEPAIANQTVGSVAENVSNSTSVGTVAVTNDTDSVAFSITAGNTGGAFAINSSTGEITVNDTSAIDYESSTSFNLTVQVTDDGGTTTDDATVTVNVTDVNEAPTATNMTQTQTYNEDDASVTLDDIVVTDVDTGDAITAILTLNNTATGALTATSGNGETYTAGTGVWTITSSVANINTALAAVAFTPATNNDVDTTVTTHIEDAATAGPANGTITLDVTAVNDAPSFTAGATLTAVNEDTTSPSGATVSSLLSSNFSDTADSDSFEGIAVSANAANASTEGSWQYSTNSGSNWYDIGASVSASAALLLNTSTMLRFVPVSNYNGAPGALTVFAVDNSAGGPSNYTSGTSTQTFNTTTDDATSAVSASGVSLSTSVTAVNDAPTISSNPTVGTVKNTDKTFSVSDFNFSDVDSGDSLNQIQITSTPDAGTLFKDANTDGIVDGGEALTTNGTVSKADIDAGKFKFKPATDSETTQAFQYKVHDGTAYSSSAGTMTIDILLPGLWTGTNGISWNDGGNWDDGNVPTSTVDVDIPNVTNKPTVDITNAACQNLNIQTGATLTIPAGNTLTVNGTYTKNGTGKISASGGGKAIIKGDIYKGGTKRIEVASTNGIEIFSSLDLP